VCYVVASVFRGKNQRPYKLRDFMPAWYRDLTEADESTRVFEQLLKMAETNQGGDEPSQRSAR
jgi:hypothetical protein